MNIGQLLFSPSGRVSPADFMKGAYILIGIGFVLALLPLVSLTLSGIGSIISLVLIFCWVVLFIKRYHEGGKSGWMTLIPIAVFLLASFVLSPILLGIFSPEYAELQAQMEAQAAEAAASGAGIGEIFGTAMEGAEAIAKASAIPSAIIGAVLSFAIAFGFNKIIPVDPTENRFGLPASGGYIA